MEDYNKVHLWVGTNFNPEDEYEKYFELDYCYPDEVDYDGPDYKICQFAKDIGRRSYDQDFIGIIPRWDEEVDLDEVLTEAAVDEDEKDSVKEICANLGIKKANAIFWYQDSELEIPKPYKDNYNGLKYIGVFVGD